MFWIVANRTISIFYFIIYIHIYIIYTIHILYLLCTFCKLYIFCIFCRPVARTRVWRFLHSTAVRRVIICAALATLLDGLLNRDVFVPRLQHENVARLQHATLTELRTVNIAWRSFLYINKKWVKLLMLRGNIQLQSYKIYKTYKNI